jgi:hypothetical protein
MAATNYTPISLYYSSTATNTPSAGNLVLGELAINIADGKLYYKNPSNVVTLLAVSGGAITPITNNGVVYINGSGQAVSGSVLTFDGAQLGVNGITVGRGAGAVVSNTAVGATALASNSSGADNVGIGYQSAYSNTTGNYNSALGRGALYSNTTGASNTAIGQTALGNNTTASYNTAVGYQASYSNVTGTETVAVGYQALYSNTGSQSTAVGAQALRNNTTGSNAAFGQFTLYGNTTGTANAAFGGYGGSGNQTMLSNSTGSNNSAFGMGALAANTTASNNSAFGYQAAYANTTGALNAAFGRYALLNNTTGGSNTAIGTDSMGANTTGGSNTALGYAALNSNTTASNNTAVGYQALYLNNTASYNTALGWQALYAATAAGNIGIGPSAGANLTTGTYGIFIGYGPYAGSVSSVNEIVIGNAGALSITGKGSNTAFISANGGSSYNGANVTTWATTSDQRIKKNIVNLGDSLGKINALRVVEFDYKENDKHEVGFVAQEFQQQFPEQIVYHSPSEAEKDWVGDDQVMAIQQNLVPFLVKAIQELTARIAVLEAK